MKFLTRLYENAMDYVLEPALYWMIDHPILTALALGVLIWWVGQNYRTRMQR
jgi:hypothetical protein